MSISSVATRIGIALDPHTRNFIRSEFTVRRNEIWAQGCSRVHDDEIIEGLMDDLFDDIGSIIQCGTSAEISRRGLAEVNFDPTQTGRK
jgi:hypothetical protein